METTKGDLLEALPVVFNVKQHTEYTYIAIIYCTPPQYLQTVIRSSNYLLARNTYCNTLNLPAICNLLRDKLQSIALNCGAINFVLTPCALVDDRDSVHQRIHCIPNRSSSSEESGHGTLDLPLIHSQCPSRERTPERTHREVSSCTTYSWKTNLPQL